MRIKDSPNRNTSGKIPLSRMTDPIAFTPCDQAPCSVCYKGSIVDMRA